MKLTPTIKRAQLVPTCTATPKLLPSSILGIWSCTHMDTCEKPKDPEIIRKTSVVGPSATHHVQLLLQRLDLRLHHLQQPLHLLVAEDGATGGSWRTHHSQTSA